MRPIVMNIVAPPSLLGVRARLRAIDKKLSASLSSQAADVAPSLFVELRVDRHTRPEPPERYSSSSASEFDLPHAILRQTSSSSSSTCLFPHELEAGAGSSNEEATPGSDPHSAALDRLHHLCAEIIATEQLYAADLSLLCEHFTRPLHGVAPELAPELHATCEKLEAVHAELVTCMAAASSTCAISSTRAVAMALETAASSHFGVYAEYCAGFMAALQALEAARHSRPEVEQVVQRAQCEIGRARVQGAASGAIDLFSMLIKPVQRICQYPLLFREVASEAAEACAPEDRERVEAVLVALELSAAGVNEHVRQKDGASLAVSPVASRSFGAAKVKARIRRHKAVTPSPPLRRHVSLPTSTQARSCATGCLETQPTRGRRRRSSVSAALGFMPPSAAAESPTNTHSRRRSSVAVALGLHRHVRC